LLEKGYIVHGINRRASSFNAQRVDHIDQDYQRRDGRFGCQHGRGGAATASCSGLNPSTSENYF